MRKSKLSILMDRLTKLAQAEYRDVEGQLAYILDKYEGKKPVATTTKRKYTKKKPVVVGKTKGKAKVMSARGKAISQGRKLAAARRKLAELNNPVGVITS